jgi:Tetratricopeptide repeat
MVCAFCGTSITEDSAFCSECGKPISGDANNVKMEIFAPAPPAPARAAEPTVELKKETPETGAILSRANLCRMRKQWPDAINLCVEVLKSAPADAAAHSLLGDIYRDQGKPEEAARWYRMALNLRDNAFDKAHLSKAEAEIKRKNATAAPVTASGAPGGMPGGPDQRAWLKAITVASVIFLFGFLVFLRFAPVPVADLPKSPQGQMANLSDPSAGPDGMPPARLGGPAVLPPGETPKSRPQEHIAGTGLQPDSGSVTMPVQQSSGQPNQQPGNKLEPAPVQQVTPIAGGQPTPPAGSTTWHSTSLTDGIQMAFVDASRGSASVHLFAPSGMDARTKQAPLVRNLMRAARTVMENDATLSYATVVITSGSKDGPVVMSGQVDRDTALNTDPDKESVETISGRIKIQ